MSTWTLEQISNVRGLWAETTVDEARTTQADALWDAVRSELFKTLRHMAHPFAVELDGGDLEFHKSDVADRPWMFTVKARWNPSTHEVELRGGPADGRILAVARVGESLKVPVLTAPVYLMDADLYDPTGDLTPSNAIRYDYAGWNESGRRWVYSAQQG